MDALIRLIWSLVTIHIWMNEWQLKRWQKIAKRGSTLAILVAWEIRKHRNYCVFNGSNPNITVVLRAVSLMSAFCGA